MNPELPALTDEELTALIAVDPTADPVNPWNPKYDNTPRGKDIRYRYEMANPDLAAGLKSKAPNVQLSAQALAYERGLVPLTEAIHTEMMEKSLTYRQQQQSKSDEYWKGVEERQMQGARELAARNGNPDPTLDQQPHNPALGGRHFHGYFENLNEVAARERAAQEQGYQPRI